MTKALLFAQTVRWKKQEGLNMMKDVTQNKLVMFVQELRREHLVRIPRDSNLFFVFISWMMVSIHLKEMIKLFWGEIHCLLKTFWGCAIFKTALRKFSFQRHENIEKLSAFLLSASDREFFDFFEGTEAATFAFKNNDKTTQSIRSVLSSQIEGLRQLETSEEVFSIRDWVMSEGCPDSSKTTATKNSAGLPARRQGWLFITARADQRQTLTPLISAWVDMAINALMVLPENYNRRLWFVIDELAALQRLPRLQIGLAEGRKYGGCFLGRIPKQTQLEEIYGRNGAESMLDLFNTKLFFRCTEPSSQQWISKLLGDKEEAEPTENISYGANSTRDDVSLSRHTRQKPLVLPAEFSQLQDLECYVKLPGDYPCTKLQMKYQKTAFLKVEPFLLKVEQMREYPITPPKGCKIPEDTGAPPQNIASVQESETPQSSDPIPEDKEELM